MSATYCQLCGGLMGWTGNVRPHGSTVCECGGPLAKITELQDEIVHLQRERDRMREENERLRLRHQCAGCGNSKTVAILAMLSGKIACCPECTTIGASDVDEIRKYKTAQAGGGIMTDDNFKVHVSRGMGYFVWDVRVTKKNITMNEHFGFFMPYRRAKRWIKNAKELIDAMLSLEESE